MPKNYKENPVTGSEHVRFNAIHVIYPKGKTPVIRFSKERVTQFSNGKELFEQEGAVEVFFDPVKVIPIVDPETLQPTGQTATMQEAYAILYSAALQADAEDAAG